MLKENLFKYTIKIIQQKRIVLIRWNEKVRSAHTKMQYQDLIELFMITANTVKIQNKERHIHST